MAKTVSEILFETLAELGVTDCFCVVGGGAMHLDHALAVTQGMTTHFNHHEQACAMAAEGYARYAGKPACVCVTSGPGATNALTGVMGAWVDSVPMVVVSGNVRYAVSIAGSGLPLRYRGIQEFDIINSIQNMTKYSKVLTDPRAARAEARQAFQMAMEGRRGPVWLDVPLDVQNAKVEEDDLLPDYPAPDTPSVEAADVESIFSALASAKRPCILLGSAITTSHLFEELERFRQSVRVPVVAGAWMGDTLPRDAQLYYGSSGNVGPRVGNFILESADYILALGNSLSFKQAGYKLEKFAPNARIAMVDVDANEAAKLGDKVGLFAHGSLESFFELADELDASVQAPAPWVAHCDKLKARFSPYEGAEGAQDGERVGKYVFWRAYNRLAPDDAVAVLGNSQVGLVLNQIGKAKKGQRVVANCICGSMGYDLPAAVGAAVASGKPVYCVTGDGSFMMNLQELATVAHKGLPVKIALFENGGYGGIRQSQTNYFGDDYDFGSGPASGVGFPDFTAVARAFGLECRECKTNGEVEAALQWLFGLDGPGLLLVRGALDDPVVPKMVSKLDEDGNLTEPLLCDLSPFLSEGEMRWAMDVGD